MDGATWALVEAERTSLANLLDRLTPQQWESGSLCSEWRVRDVAAHLAMTPAREPGAATMARAVVRARGHLWTAGRDVAIAYAVRSGADIAHEVRATAGSRARPVFVVPENILLDLAVHGQDIAVPLGLDRPVPSAAGAVALNRVWSMGWPFWARRRLAGVTFRALDAGWGAGEGPEVSGAAADLLLLMTGRTTPALRRLRGAGVTRLVSRPGSAIARASAGRGAR